MNPTITTFEITYGLSTSENSGVVILNSKIFKNFLTPPSLNSFHFKLEDFLYGDTYEDKAFFYMSLLNEGIEVIDASMILSSLISICEDVTTFPNYSILTNVILYLSLHICEVMPTMTEEHAIQESFNMAHVVQRPASEDSIFSLEKEMFVGDGNGEDNEDNTCLICLESFIKYQSLLCIPCGHKFCEKCLISWLQINGVCPLCRYCLP